PERDGRRNRTEDLLAGRAVVGRDRREDRRREPVAGPVGRRAAEGDRRIVVDVGGDLLALVGGDERPHMRRVVERVSNAQRHDLALERLEEGLDRRALDEYARAGAAVLARVAEDGERRRGGGLLE